MHAARIGKSDRLDRVVRLLSDGRWHGTREIVHAADVCAVNSIVSELRANGLHVECEWRDQGRYEYRWTPKEPQLDLAL